MSHALKRQESLVKRGTGLFPTRNNEQKNSSKVVNQLLPADDGTEQRSRSFGNKQANAMQHLPSQHSNGSSSGSKEPSKFTFTNTIGGKTELEPRPTDIQMTKSH